MSDIFISYSHEDTDLVRDMVSALEAEGFSVWWDHTIPPGKTWDYVTARGIKEAKACIIVWTPHSVISDWVKEEATLAKEGGKYLPVQVGTDQPPIGFRRIQAADLRNWNGNAKDSQWRMLITEAASLVRGELPAERPGQTPVTVSSRRPGNAKNRLLLGVAVAALLLIAGGGWWAMSRHAPPPEVQATQTPSPPQGTPPISSTKQAVFKAKATQLSRFLGIDADQLINGDVVNSSTLLHVLETSPRRVRLGSTQEQIDAAFALCEQYATGCQREWFADETARNVVLRPFKLDSTPVSVREFRQFVASSHYRTGAEINGVAYTAVDGRLNPVKGGNWRNAVGASTPEEEAAVVGVNYADAQTYCIKQGKRLPTEDEWEYVARGPEGHVYPWGDDVGPATVHSSLQPRVADGPSEGVGGAYHGLSGAVWEWVNTDVGVRKILKGGSWRETNPANKRAATRGYELPNRGNGSTGFRCAQSVAEWPDAELWMSQIRSS